MDIPAPPPPGHRQRTVADSRVQSSFLLRGLNSKNSIATLSQWVRDSGSERGPCKCSGLSHSGHGRSKVAAVHRRRLVGPARLTRSHFVRNSATIHNSAIERGRERACPRACVRACVRACARLCQSACLCVRACVVCARREALPRRRPGTLRHHRVGGGRMHASEDGAFRSEKRRAPWANTLIRHDTTNYPSPARRSPASFAAGRRARAQGRRPHRDTSDSESDAVLVGRGSESDPRSRRDHPGPSQSFSPGSSASEEPR